MVEADELFIRPEKERNYFDLLSLANDLKKKAKIAEKEISYEVEVIKCLKEKLSKIQITVSYLLRKLFYISYYLLDFFIIGYVILHYLFSFVYLYFLLAKYCNSTRYRS